MSSGQPWYVAERAEHLAVLLFTTLPDVRVDHPVADRGIDLRVFIGRDPQQVFGVEVKGTMRIAQLVRPDGALLPGVAAELRRVSSDYQFPVGVVVCDVSSEAARFGWVAAPRVGRTFGLCRDDVITTELATVDVLRRATEEVAAWYRSRE